jgi:lysophospholipase L1-like esterase
MIDFTEKNSDMRMSEEDFHPNKKAHKYWGECLLEFINEKV